MRPSIRRLLTALVAATSLQAHCAAPAARCPDVDVGHLSKSDPTSVAGAARAMQGAPRIALAIRPDHGAALEQALASGASPDVCVLGGSLVAFAASMDDRDDLRVLLDRGVGPDSLRTATGSTALLSSISLMRFDSVDVLPARGADPRITTDGGDTALRLLTSLVLPPDSPMRARQQSLARRLLDAGVVVDARLTVRGTTSLMQSALRGDVALMRLLLDHGADASLRNVAGTSVLDFARKSGRADVVAMIEASLAHR